MQIVIGVVAWIVFRNACELGLGMLAGKAIGSCFDRKEYEGAKEMLLVDEVDNREFLAGLFQAMYEELPETKQKKKKT